MSKMIHSWSSKCLWWVSSQLPQCHYLVYNRRHKKTLNMEVFSNSYILANNYEVPTTLIRYSNPPSVFVDTSHTSPDTSVDKMQDPYSYFRNIFTRELLQNLTNDAEMYNWKLCRLMVGFAFLLQKSSCSRIQILCTALHTGHQTST